MQKKHLEHFTFNSIAVQLGETISLDTEEILEKIVVKNLGGYCFEHNQLMYEVLQSLGFDVRMSVARVILNQDIEASRTHRITILKWDDADYLVDVGFASMCPIKPIKLDDKNESNQKFRIINNKHNDYLLEIYTEKGYFSLYRFDLANYSQADCVIGNFYSSKHEDAVFVNNLVISRIFTDITLSLRNHSYHRIKKDTKEVIEIKDHKQLHSIINSDFDIPINEVDCKILFDKNS